MSNKNSNKNKQTKSVESCIEYIDGKPIVKILIVGSYSNFTFKKELGQQYDKFKKGFKENIPLEVVFAQFSSSSRVIVTFLLMIETSHRKTL